MLNNCQDFTKNVENGHSVTIMGYPYHYNGEKHSGKPSDIHALIQEVIDLIKLKHPDIELNSCLINKFCGPDAFCPEHADDEFSIAPGSFICTASVGCPATIKFREIHGHRTAEQKVEGNSLYIMSRTSQAFWKHQVPKNSSLTNEDVRYSLTFRHVSDKFLKSTVIIGDSNTRYLNFGEGPGTFGHNIPGERIEATFINKINPIDCIGYKNIFVHCGVNDIKYYKINTEQKICMKFNELKDTIHQISVLCPTSKLCVSPILPTKSMDINNRALQFNSMLFKYKGSAEYRFDTMNFNIFVDESSGFLRPDLGRYRNPEDQLHLGAKGIGLLVSMVREKVYSSVISPYPGYRKYSSVVQGNGVNRVGRDHRVSISSHLDIGAT